LHLDVDLDERFAAAHLARLQELTCLRRIAALKSKLQRTNPVDQAEDYNRMFGELIALERYRTELRERAIGGAL
jgi:DNA primase